MQEYRNDEIFNKLFGNRDALEERGKADVAIGKADCEIKMADEKKDKHWYPPYRVFRCECDSEKDLSYDEFIQHAKDKHSINVRGMKMTRQLMMHVNKSPRHSCTYSWHCPGFKFYEEVG